MRLDHLLSKEKSRGCVSTGLSVVIEEAAAMISQSTSYFFDIIGLGHYVSRPQKKTESVLRRASSSPNVSVFFCADLLIKLSGGDA